MHTRDENKLVFQQQWLTFSYFSQLFWIYAQGCGGAEKGSSRLAGSGVWGEGGGGGVNGEGVNVWWVYWVSVAFSPAASDGPPEHSFLPMHNTSPRFHLPSQPVLWLRRPVLKGTCSIRAKHRSKHALSLLPCSIPKCDKWGWNFVIWFKETVSCPSHLQLNGIVVSISVKNTQLFWDVRTDSN